MPDQVDVFVGTEKLVGWKSVQVFRSIESVSNGFAISMSELEEDDPARRILNRGDAVEVRLGDVLVLSGFIWKLAPRYDAGSHSVDVSGWDRTKDLTKASLSTKIKTPASLETLVAGICRPFDITVSSDVDTGSQFQSYRPELGATADATIDQLVRMRGVIRVSDGVGGLLLTLPGSDAAIAELVKGRNVLSANAVFDDSERFSIVTLEAQREGAWGGDSLGAPISASASDPDVRRFLPLLEIPKDPPDGQVALNALAQREVNLRAARGERVNYTAKGWRHNGDEGPVWTPGELVSVFDPWLGVDRDLLLTTATFTYTKNKRRTVLQLLRPEAFDLRPLKEKTTDGPGLWGVE